MPTSQTPLISTSCDQGESLADLVAGLESGRWTSAGLVQTCLNRIAELDDQVRAWVMVDGDSAMQAARQADTRRAQQEALSRLDGIPVGVKDIIDVAGWPTTAAFGPWANRVATEDAPIVTMMRQAGLVPLGKTVTTQFAGIDPPPTRNPWHLGRTPGGSSSGSCAAVACGMVPMALGSQTGGSINRPASFCGVAGLKLNFSDWPVAGVVACSPSLDTLGPIVRRAADLPLVLEALPTRCKALYKKPLTAEPLSPRPLQVLVLGGRFHELAEPEMRQAVAEAADRLQQAGCNVACDESAGLFTDELWQVHRTIMMRECYLTHQQRFESFTDHYAPKFRGWVEAGREISDPDYDEAQTSRGRFMGLFARTYQQTDALLLPAALGEAGTPETTGDPVLNALWTLLGVPSLTVPVMLSRQKLPLGVQLVVPSHSPNKLDRVLDAASHLQ